jgi:Fur family zinc uptake transcriptional regulator
MTSESNKISAATGPLGFAQHDHSTCVSEAIAAAEARCAADSLRFTPVRRKVFEILLQEHRALGAYSILDRLREDGFATGFRIERTVVEAEGVCPACVDKADR